MITMASSHCCEKQVYAAHKGDWGRKTLLGCCQGETFLQFCQETFFKRKTFGQGNKYLVKFVQMMKMGNWVIPKWRWIVGELDNCKRNLNLCFLSFLETNFFYIKRWPLLCNAVGGCTHQKLFHLGKQSTGTFSNFLFNILSFSFWSLFHFLGVVLDYILITFPFFFWVLDYTFFHQIFKTGLICFQKLMGAILARLM